MPLLLIDDLIGLDTHERVDPHPLDLLSGGGKAVETSLMINKIDRHHIGLEALDTGQSAEMCSVTIGPRLTETFAVASMRSMWGAGIAKEQPAGRKASGRLINKYWHKMIVSQVIDLKIF